MVYAMVYEVSRALGIYAFTITRKRPDRLTRSPPPSPLTAPSPPRARSPGKRRKAA